MRAGSALKLIFLSGCALLLLSALEPRAASAQPSSEAEASADPAPADPTPSGSMPAGSTSTSAEDLASFEQSQQRIKAPQRITGIAEVGVGWLTLPRALVCGDGQMCRRGDTTPFVDVWNLVRLDIGLAFGAGITLGLIPTTDAPRSDPPGISRNHRRGYMTIESLVRYYAWRTENVEGWLGGGVGLVIVSDSFVSDEERDQTAFVGSPGVTLRTEGLSLLGGVGVSIVLSEYWTLGFTGRAGTWSLPDDPVRSPLGDEASLSGSNTVIYAGLSIGFQQGF